MRGRAYSALLHLICPKSAQNSGGSNRASKSSELTTHGARTDQHPTASDINSDLTHVWTVELRKCRVSTDNAHIMYSAHITRGNGIFFKHRLADTVRYMLVDVQSTEITSTGGESVARTQLERRESSACT